MTHGHETVDALRTQPLDRSQKKRDSFFLELVKFAFVALVLVLPIRLYIAQPFIVSGSSMNPTFENGEYLIVDEFSYRFENPERGDVVIFRFPKDPSKFFIKRIIGLPGETVDIRRGAITITNDGYPDGRALNEPYVRTISRDTLTLSLKDTEYFVMGDNRRASSDSRVWGPLEENFIVGRAFLRLLPVTRLGVFPGDFEGNVDGL